MFSRFSNENASGNIGYKKIRSIHGSLLQMRPRRHKKTPAAWRNNLIGIKWRFLRERPIVQAPTPSPSDPRFPQIDFDIQQYASLLDDLDNRPASDTEDNEHSALDITESQQQIDDRSATSVLDSTGDAPQSLLSLSDDEDSDEVDDVSVDFDSIAERSRSPSPVVIWRPSTRVHVATDLPPQLKSVFWSDSSTQVQATQAASKPSLPSHRKRPGAQQQTVFPGSTFGVQKIKPRPRRKAMSVSDISDVEEEITAKPEHMDNQDRERLTEVTAQIPNLFISKAYKGYIKEQPDGGNRIPYYLRNTAEYRSTGQ